MPVIVEDEEGVPKIMLAAPPGGQSYGFPLPLPASYVLEEFDLAEWLAEQGYPKDHAQWGAENCVFLKGTLQ